MNCCNSLKSCRDPVRRRAIPQKEQLSSGKRSFIIDFRDNVEADVWIGRAERMLHELDPGISSSAEVATSPHTVDPKGLWPNRTDKPRHPGLQRAVRTDRADQTSLGRICVVSESTVGVPPPAKLQRLLEYSAVLVRTALVVGLLTGAVGLVPADSAPDRRRASVGRARSKPSRTPRPHHWEGHIWRCPTHDDDRRLCGQKRKPFGIPETADVVSIKGMMTMDEYSTTSLLTSMGSVRLWY
jgi:hypothetical protein